jgi:hypothetical protein
MVHSRFFIQFRIVSRFGGIATQPLAGIEQPAGWNRATKMKPINLGRTGIKVFPPLPRLPDVRDQQMAALRARRTRKTAVLPPGVGSRH